MQFIALLLIGVVAALHFYFLVLEMFLWQRPLGRKIFKTTAADAATTATLAANQGLYNGFLAAGLIWAIFAKDEFGPSIATFFLGCVVVAGIFGAKTVNPRIFFVQSVPAILALAAVWL